MPKQENKCAGFCTICYLSLDHTENNFFKGSLLILADAWDNIQQLRGFLILLSIMLQVDSLPVTHLIKHLKHLAQYTPDI